MKLGAKKKREVESQENVTVSEILDKRIFWPAVSDVTGVRCQVQQRMMLDGDLHKDSETE